MTPFLFMLYSIKGHIYAVNMSLSFLPFEKKKTYNKSRSAQSQDRPALPFLGLVGPRPEAPRGLECQPRPAPPPKRRGPSLGLPEADPRPGHTTLLLNEGIPRALKGKKLRLKNILLLPLIFEEINYF